MPLDKSSETRALGYGRAGELYPLPERLRTVRGSIVFRVAIILVLVLVLVLVIIRSFLFRRSAPTISGKTGWSLAFPKLTGVSLVSLRLFFLEIAALCHGDLIFDGKCCFATLRLGAAWLVYLISVLGSWQGSFSKKRSPHSPQFEAQRGLPLEKLMAMPAFRRFRSDRYILSKSASSTAGDTEVTSVTIIISVGKQPISRQCGLLNQCVDRGNLYKQCWGLSFVTPLREPALFRSCRTDESC